MLLKTQYQYLIKSRKRVYLLFFYSILFTFHLSAQIPQKHCPETTQFFNETKHNNLERFTQKWIQKEGNSAISRGAIIIPVVVHIVYQTAAENISDEQVYSQIAALNRDFNLENQNLDIVAEEFQDRIANVGFEFCLASIDAHGNPTGGITRTPTLEDNVFFGGAQWIYYSDRGGHDAWDTKHYLNIWVTRTSEALGFGSSPGLNAPTEDGIVVAPQSFGTLGSVIPPFHLGRIATHEVGHYFNLLHPWGARTDCNHDDFVKDTPLQSRTYSGCPDLNSSSCDSRDITVNYMNWSEDECLAMFTRGQALRMQAALIGARKELLNSNGCGKINIPNPTEVVRIYPNPASYYFCIETNSSSIDTIPFRMLDTKGAVIIEGTVVPNTIQHFPATQKGIYILQFFVGEEPPIVKKIAVF